MVPVSLETVETGMRRNFGIRLKTNSINMREYEGSLWAKKFLVWEYRGTARRGDFKI